MNNEKGYTLLELLLGLGTLAMVLLWIAAFGGIVYAIAHFVSKFW